MLSVLFKEQFDNLRDILDFYLEPRSKILDITYGHGKLWQWIGKGIINTWQIYANDIDPESPAMYHYSFKDLSKIPDKPYHAILYDPPYKYGQQSYVFFQSIESDLDWKAQKTKWTVQNQIDCAILLDKILPSLLRDDGIIIVKIMNTRYKKKLIKNNQIIIDNFTNFELKDEYVYVRLGVGVFKNKKSPQTAHGYYLIFRK